MSGDATLFVRQDAVEAAWAVVQSSLDHDAPVQEYEPGTWGPDAAERLASHMGGWHNPRAVSETRGPTLRQDERRRNSRPTAKRNLARPVPS
jgi:hypothetical protein